MRSRRWVLVLALLWVVTASGLSAKTGFYVLGRVGISQFDVAFGDTWVRSFDDTPTSFALEAGYRFLPFLAVQAGYHDFGELSGLGIDCPDSSRRCPDPASALSMDPSGWSVSLMAQTPKLLLVRFYGKLGIMKWDAPLDLGRGESESFSGTDPLMGAGVRFTFLPKFEAILEYERFQMGSDSDLTSGFDQTVQTVSVGIGFKF